MKTTAGQITTINHGEPAEKCYLPINDEARLVWLGHFSARIGNYSPLLGISEAEANAISLWHEMLRYTLELIDETEFFASDLCTFKDHLMFAPVGSVQGTMPYLPIATPPSINTAGIFSLIDAIVKRIKSSANYTPAIGKDLGIIGSDFHDDHSTKQPVLTISMELGRPKIFCKKNRTDGINLYVDRNGTGMQLYKFIGQSTFVDTFDLAIGENNVVWKYMAKYIVKNVEVGMPSEEVTIIVKRRM